MSVGGSLTTSSFATSSTQKDEPAPTYASASERIKATKRFYVEDVALLGSIHERFDFAPGTPWDDFRECFLVVPDWYRFGLDPMSEEYAQQQQKLWGVVAGVNRAYNPLIDEKEAPLLNVDAVRFPGHFVRRDPLAVESMADQIFATGMLMRHGGLKPGQWALEYGAGFAQIALKFARLGVNVDTVDISQEFCKHVKTQADFYGVPLTPFQGRFGWNPRGEQKYDLIWFFEAFHHCTDFRSVVYSLKRNLSQTGRILLAGEPISRREDKHVPYPWGLRLDSETVAVVRVRHWFELGFSEDFIVTLFINAGFVAERMECPLSPVAEGYIFRHRPDSLKIGRHWLPSVENDSWHGGQGDGRWTREESFLTLDTTDSFAALEIETTNYHPVPQSVGLIYGNTDETEIFQPGEHRTVRIDAKIKAGRLIFRSRTLVPAEYPGSTSTDTRALGIFVREVRYV